MAGNTFLNLIASKRAHHGLDLLSQRNEDALPEVPHNRGIAQALALVSEGVAHDAMSAGSDGAEDSPFTDILAEHSPQCHATGQVQIECWLNEDLLQNVDKLALASGVSRSQLIEQAVAVLCDEQRAWWDGF